MKNNPNTQERSPIFDDSPSPSLRPQNKSLLAYPWLLVVGLGALLMAIATVAILSLTNTGRIEKDPAKQTTLFNQTTTPTKSQSNSSPNWLPIIFYLSAGVASVVAIYKWRLPIAKRHLTRRQQRKLSLQYGRRTTTPPITPEITLENNSSTSNLETLLKEIPEDLLVEPILMDVTPEIALLPPEQAQGSQSLAEMMDIRKHLSLDAILQDFRRKE